MKALHIHAGPRALARLREGALQPADVRVIPAAAGGPKGLVLNRLDRFLFGDWLPRGGHSVHLLGASIGAWRMAVACLPNADAALAQMAEDYIDQRYDHAPGKPPTAAQVSAGFGAKLAEVLGGDATAQLLRHPRHHLHVFTSHGRQLLAREGRARTALGYGGAWLANALQRRWLGGWLERVVFSDPRAALPFDLDDFRTQRVALGAANLQAAVLASCSIPFWLQAVHNLPGAPRGAYWDGGITDYHLHLNYAAMGQGLVLYPHFQATVVPGWLDKAWRGRHRATPALDNVILLSPRPEWLATLPGGKLPDRSDFHRFGADLVARRAAWGGAVAEGQRLADEFAQWVAGGCDVSVVQPW